MCNLLKMGARTYEPDGNMGLMDGIPAPAGPEMSYGLNSLKGEI